MIYPDINLAKQHLQLLDPEATKFTLQSFCDLPQKYPQMARIMHGSIDELFPQLVELNQSGAGIFITINNTDFKGRTSGNITHIRSFFAEADGPLKCQPPLEPTFRVMSRKGAHMYWVLDKPSDQLNLFTPVEETINSTLGSDPAVKDLPRVLRLAGFYHQKVASDPRLITLEPASMMSYSLEEILEAFPTNFNKRTQWKGVSTSTRKGTLMPKVQEFLKRNWNRSASEQPTLVLAISNLKKNNYSLEECIEIIESKGEKLNRNTLSQINAIYKSSDYRIDPFLPAGGNSYNDFIRTAEIYKDITQTDELYLVDQKKQLVERIKQTNVDAILGTKERIARTTLCKRDYNPHRSSILGFDDHNMPVLNTYNPPFWKKPGYLNDIEIEMPEVYEAFFDHLFPSEESRNYCLDWLSYSLIGKNIPILGLVGTNRGLGKGVLGYILRELHGKSNTETCKQSILSKEFNSHIYGKSFIHLDEVAIETDAELETIKAFTNPSINYEGKGSNSETKPFHANIYLTNNRVSSLSGVEIKSDRQFSILDVTSKTMNLEDFLKYSPSSKVIDFMWEDRKLIAQFANYLKHRDLTDYDYTKNFKSDHYYKVIRSSVPEWVRFILEEVSAKHQGCAVPFLQIKQLMTKFGEAKVGRVKFEGICNEYWEQIAYAKIGLVPYVFFPKKDESGVDFQIRLANPSSFSILKMVNSLSEDL